MKLLAEIGELVAAGNRDAVRQISLGERAGAAQELGERRAEPLQEQHHQSQRHQNGDDRMDLTDPLEPAQQPRRVGVDPIDLGGLVGDRDLDQLVELLVDAALEKREQRRPGRVRPPPAAQLLDILELVERMLVFAS